MSRVSPIAFFRHLRWLDGRPLLDTIEDYRLKIFLDVLDNVGAEGRPLYNMALIGRGKKNYKSSDLCLAALYRLLACDGPHGNDCYVVALDHDQARDDLRLAEKIVAANPVLAVHLS